MRNDLKIQLKEKAELVKDKAESALNSIYEGVEPAKGRPKIELDESLVIRAGEGKAYWYIVGIIIWFIPPFIFGPILILATYYFGSNSGVMVTNRRVVIFHKKLKPDMYSSVEIPVKHIIEVRRLPITHFMESIGERLLGSGSFVIKWESTTEGTRTSVVPRIRGPKKVVAAINDVVNKAKI